ncbi:octanoyltransferase LipM [Abditibacteriota bacterium]|nr:octanoyltransferase LipM [Abditibacteriota bacterium]
MQLLDFSASSPAENLAVDEALLDFAEEEGGAPTLRFWESSSYFVALGYTNRAATETNMDECKARDIPILRRVTGGGTVLQGVGCLNYALVDRIEKGQALNVGATNDFVMSRVRDALKPLLEGEVAIQGHTDLTWRGLKFSGNAQKRRAHFFLFHGTVLVDFDLELVGSVLRPPSKEPTYRAKRSHLDFITNVPLQREVVKSALAAAFDANEPTGQRPMERVEQLVEKRYARSEWNFRF